MRLAEVGETRVFDLFTIQYKCDSISYETCGRDVKHTILYKSNQHNLGNLCGRELYELVDHQTI